MDRVSKCYIQKLLSRQLKSKMLLSMSGSRIVCVFVFDISIKQIFSWRGSTNVGGRNDMFITQENRMGYLNEASCVMRNDT